MMDKIVWLPRQNQAKVGKLKMEMAIPLDRVDVYLSFS